MQIEISPIPAQKLYTAKQAASTRGKIYATTCFSDEPYRFVSADGKLIAFNGKSQSLGVCDLDSWEENRGAVFFEVNEKIAFLPAN